MIADNDNGERWLPVVGFEGRYEVSDLGRVRSLRYRGHDRIAVMKTTQNYGGYLVVTLGAERKQLRVPRMVLEAFVGPCPERHEACHGPDFSKSNNRLDNLRWDTSKANCQERPPLVGLNNFKGKLSDEQAAEVHRRYCAGENDNLLAVEFDITPQRVKQLGNRERFSLRLSS